jgi:hypothetical protein
MLSWRLVGLLRAPFQQVAKIAASDETNAYPNSAISLGCYSFCLCGIAFWSIFSFFLSRLRGPAQLTFIIKSFAGINKFLKLHLFSMLQKGKVAK